MHVDNPGLLFVAATLVPLASFVVLLLWGAVRWLLRPYAQDGGPASAIFDALGGNVGGRAPAILATVAIGLSCVLCITGFVLFLMDHHDVETAKHSLEEQIKNLENPATAPPPGKGGAKLGGGQPKPAAQPKNAEKDLAAKRAALHQEEEEFEHRWSGSMPWAGVLPRVAADAGSGTLENPGNGTLLTLGFKIDMLSAIMFVMVSFIATLIHVFSLGYMAEEVQPMVEDHEVHAESGHYRRRGRFGRFFMFLSLFCFSMFNLILADNLFQIFVSWELVGICSFLLVGFYFERQSASNAANKAFITNRVGDAGFLIGLMILWTYVGTFSFDDLFHRLRAPEADGHHKKIEQHDRIVTANRVGEITAHYEPKNAGEPGVGESEPRRVKTGQRLQVVPMSEEAHGSDVLIFPRDQGHIHFDMRKKPADGKGPATRIEVRAYDTPEAADFGYIPYWMLVLAGLGIFLGCVGKSAQFPLQVWLPDAMEGPTPVSALIHAATMVAAGVYLVARAYPLFLPEVLLVIAYTGAITLFVAATIAVVMTDIKKVLAYSTVSQLGYMMLALGVGGWVAGAFHLLTHAFFKALLFLGSGSVIYGCHHQQDMLKMGGLYPKMRITACTMLMGVLAICGVPLFAGWYSKDAILVSALSFTSAHSEHVLLFVLPLVTAGLTTFYMFRMWFMTFTGKPRDLHVYDHAHESPWLMTIPLILLAILSVCVAWGIPPWKAHESQLAHQLEHSQPAAVAADFGKIVDEKLQEAAGYHDTVFALASLTVLFGVAFAWVIYYKRALEPEDAKDQFLGIHKFLSHKWWFDEFYSVAIVRPGLILARWARAFDTYVIDGIIHLVAWLGVATSRWSGKVDRGIVDGLVNVIADVSYGIGSWLRRVQTGYLRSYVLFLALAAIAMWFLMAQVFGIAIGSQ
jgi:NADH-quinone oxidoreductase subunit L